MFATDGRGLFLVQSLADEWGYEQESCGTTVWFRLAASARGGRGLPRASTAKAP